MRRLLDRLHLTPSPRGPSQKLLVLSGLLGSGAVLFLLFLGVHAQKSIPGIPYYYTSAVFPQADNVRPHARVRIAGVDVGQVASTKLQGGKAIVRLQLKGSLNPLRSDTQVRVRPESAVGTRFIELVPGSKGRPLPDDAVLPAGHTSVEVSLDRVLDTLDARRRAHAQVLLNQLGVGTYGRGEDANVALRDLPPTLLHVDRIAGAINARGGLAPFVRGAQGAANAADPVRQDIADGFGSQQRTLQPFVDRAPDLQATLDQAPPTLQTAATQLPRVTPLLRQVEAFGRAAVPALQIGRGTLDETSGLLVEARPGLRAVPTTLPLIVPATPATLRLLRIVGPVLPGVDTALRSALPIVTELGGRRCDLQQWVFNWADILSYGDAQENYLRYDILADQTSVPGQKGPRPGVHATPYPAPCTVEHQKATG